MCTCYCWATNKHKRYFVYLLFIPLARANEKCANLSSKKKRKSANKMHF